MRRTLVFSLLVFYSILCSAQNGSREYPSNFDPTYVPGLSQPKYTPAKSSAGAIGKKSSGSVIFFDDMESGENGWSTEGFMHLSINPQNTQVLNPQINPTLVLLPDEGKLPLPHSGVSAWWYGEEETGTFIGKDFIVEQGYLTGGTSVEANTGSLISPVIDLTQADNAVLSFYSWWEIEGVDADGFDLMFVDISIDNGTNFEILGTLNPVNDYDGEHHIPFTIGGLGKKAKWSKNVFNLNNYRGNQVIIRFRFMTVDQLYNGFRGWLIDDVSISTGELLPPVIESVSPSSGNVGSNFEIFGENFTGGANVYMGETLIQSSVISENEINCIVPVTTNGIYDIKVVNTDLQEAILPSSFTVTDAIPPGIISLTPDSKIINESVEVNIFCENLSQDAVATIGGLELIDPVIVDNVITGMVPANLSLGSHNVRVQNPDGLYDLRVNAFHVLPVLEITAPNGGEILTTNLGYEVKFRLSKSSTGEIFFSSNNGFSWTSIYKYTDYAPGNHSFIWNTIPVINSNHCLLKIQDSNVPSLMDISNDVFTVIPGSNLPKPPTGLKLLNKSLEQVSIGWQDNSVNEDGFRIYRKTGGEWVLINTTKTTEFTDNSINAGKTYYYKIVSYNSHGESDFSNILAVSVGSVPIPPDNLTLTVVSDSEIKLVWKDQSNNENGFKIERKTSSTSWSEIKIRSANSQLYTDKNLAAGKEYSYRIRAFNDYGNSDYCAEKSAETGSLPFQPFDVSATVTGTHSIKLNWKDYSDNEDGFYIYQKAYNSGYYSKIDEVGKNTEAYHATNLASGKVYYYKIVSFNEYGHKESNPVYATTGSKPNIPKNLVAKEYQDNKILLEWVDNSSNETRFQIEQKINNGGYSFYKNLAAGQEKTYTSPLKLNRKYQYRIKAINEWGESNWTESNTIELSDGTFSCTFSVTDKFGKVVGAEVYKKPKYSNSFIHLSEYTTNSQGKVTVNGLQIGDEILIRDEKENLAYPSVKSSHEKVDDKSFVVFYDNGEMQESGTYKYSKFTQIKEFWNIELKNAVIGYNLIVSLDFKDNAQDYKTSMERASKYFFNVCDGQAFFNKVYIYENGKNQKSADIKIMDSYDVVHPNANLSIFGLYKNDYWLIDRRIKMDRKWVVNYLYGGTVTKVPAYPGDDDYDRTIIHEFGHYGLGFYDEYLDGSLIVKKDFYDGINDKFNSVFNRKNNPQKYPTNYGFMDSQYSSTEMSSYNDYNESYSWPTPSYEITAQLRKRRFPCWQYFRDDMIERANTVLKTPDYGYFLNGSVIGGKDRPGPFKVPDMYHTIVEYDSETKKSSDGYNTTTIKVKDDQKLFIKSGNKLNFIGQPGNHYRIQDENDCEVLTFDNKSLTVKTLNIDTQNEAYIQPSGHKLKAGDISYNSGILVKTVLKQVYPTFLIETLFQFDQNLPSEPYIKYYFSEDTGQVILTSLGPDKYLGTMQIDPSKPEYDGTGYFEIMFNDTSGNEITYIDKVSFTGLDYEELNLIYNYRLFTIIDNSNLDEIKLMVINNTFGTPINAYNQQLIPVSEMYSLDIEGDNNLSDGTGLSISYDDTDTENIDENTIDMYTWNENDRLWVKIDSSIINILTNSVSAPIFSEGSFALFATGLLQDSIAPDPVTDLISTAAGNGKYELEWTAVGDDESDGKALGYDIRWFTDSITGENWDSCFNLPGPSPEYAGFKESWQVSIPDSINTCFFALKAFDEAGYISVLSNIAQSQNFLLIENPAFAFKVEKDYEILDAVFIGKDLNASKNFDTSLDLLQEPDTTLRMYIRSEDENELKTDFRNDKDTLIQWPVYIEFNDTQKDSLILSWDKTSIPSDGYYFIEDFNLKDTGQIVFHSDTSFVITYKAYKESIRIADIIKDEDFEPVQIQLADYFIVEDTLEYHIITSDNIADYSITDGNILEIKSLQDLYGHTEVIVEGVGKESDVYRQYFEMTINPVNDYPVFLSDPDTLTYVDSMYSYQIEFSDVDTNDSVYIQSVTLPAWLYYDTENKQLTGRPELADFGEHEVSIVITDGLEQVTQDFTITVDKIITDLDNYFSRMIRVFPNPTEDKIQIHYEGKQEAIAILSIYSPEGKLLLRKKDVNLENRFTLDMKEYPAGMYLLKIEIDDASVIRNIVLK